MSIKKDVKRLALNKTTISNLNGAELQNARGGLSALCSVEPTLCNTYPILECNTIKPNTGCAPSDTNDHCFPTQNTCVSIVDCSGGEATCIGC